jgi:hypothetical protein
MANSRRKRSGCDIPDESDYDMRALAELIVDLYLQRLNPSGTHSVPDTDTTEFPKSHRSLPSTDKFPW